MDKEEQIWKIMHGQFLHQKVHNIKLKKKKNLKIQVDD